jgi:AraC-like DNA-binding protein
MFIAATLFSLLNAIILFASSGKRNQGNKYLAFIFIYVTLRGFASGTALQALNPFLQKLFFNNLLPLFFLFGPITYFYIRLEVLDISFKIKRDFKHLLVFSLSFINMVPYYMNSTNFKNGIIELSLQNPLSYLYVNFWMFDSPAYYIGGPIHNLFYLTLSLYTISNRSHSLSKKLSDASFKELINWLYLFITVFYAFTISNCIFATYVYVTGKSLFMIPPVVSGILFLYLNVQIYKHPQVLFGIKFSKSPNANSIVHINKAKPKIETEATFEMKFNRNLEQYHVNKEYATSDFTMAFIAKDLEIPEYILNNYFKNELKVKFTDFRNELRIKYFFETINKVDLIRYTANAIANKYGFSNIKSLKKAFDTCQPESYEAFHSKLMNN